MKKLLLLAVVGFAVFADTQLQARKVCDMVLKSEGFTVPGKEIEGRCESVHEGETFTCPTVTCPACPSLKCEDVSCPPCMCEAPKKVECNCTPNITVQEDCHEVCTSCRQLKADCGCGHKGGHNHKHGNRRGRRSAEVVME